MKSRNIQDLYSLTFDDGTSVDIEITLNACTDDTFMLNSQAVEFINKMTMCQGWGKPPVSKGDDLRAVGN